MTGARPEELYGSWSADREPQGARAGSSLRRRGVLEELLHLLAALLRLFSDDLVEGIRSAAQRLHDAAGGELVRREASRT